MIWTIVTHWTALCVGILIGMLLAGLGVANSDARKPGILARFRRTNHLRVIK